MSAPPSAVRDHVGIADAYRAGVLDGSIPACRWIRLACERGERDRAKQNTAAFPYRFDTAAANRVCRFVETLHHVEGDCAVRGETIRLEGWQLWVITEAFGWLRANGARRFRSVMTVIPRKSGKSLLSAAIALYMLCADGETGAKILCGASTEKQAWKVFGPVRKMCELNPRLVRRFGLTVNARSVVRDGNSAISCLIGKPGDGDNPSCAIIDEFHEHADATLRDAMVHGMGARRQPLAWTITTAGFDTAGPCYDDVLTGRQLLQEQFSAENRLYVEFGIDEGDDWTNPAILRKANPNAGISVGLDYLIEEQEKAIRSTAAQPSFLTKQLNQWVNSRAGWHNLAAVARCRDPMFDPEKYRGRRVYVGLDLASKNDIAAIQVLCPLDGGNYATWGRYYLPEDTITAPGNDHYAAWVREQSPMLFETPGNMIDLDRIAADLDEIRSAYTVAEIVFDPAQATWLMQRLQARGVPVVSFVQYALNYSEPMKQTAALFDAGKIVHGDAPNGPFSWQIGNVTAKLDAKDQVFPRKERAEFKIDAAVALYMAMSRAMAAATPKVSRYQTHGFRGF